MVWSIPFQGWSPFVSTYNFVRGLTIIFLLKYFQNAGLCYSIGGTRLQ